MRYPPALVVTAAVVWFFHGAGCIPRDQTHAGGRGAACKTDADEQACLDLIREAAAGLVADDYRHREALAKTILAIQDACLEALVTRARGGDAEGQIRANALLKSMLRACAVAQFHASLSRSEYEKFAVFSQRHREILDFAFSQDVTDRCRALKMLDTLSDPRAEPLLIHMLRFGAPEVRTAAVRVVQNGKYRSEALVRAVLDILAGTPRRAWALLAMHDRHRFPCLDNQALTGLGAVRALAAMKRPAAAPELLRLLQSPPDYLIAERDCEIARALGATREKRAIPALMELLKKDSRIFEWGGEARGDTAVSDLALMALLGLTNQSAKDYGFVHYQSDGGKSRVFGFGSQAKRRIAVNMFRQWWDENQIRDEYRDLVPLVVPKRAIGNGG